MENCKGSTLDTMLDFTKHSDSDLLSDEDSSNDSENSYFDDPYADNISNKELFNNELTFKKMVRQLLFSVKCLHDIGIVHRDLKMQNIMLLTKSNENQNMVSSYN